MVYADTVPLYSGIFEALRYSSFQVASIISTCGFITANYDLWPTFSQAVLLLLMFIGGCAGNTQGVARLVVGMTAEEAVKKIKGIKCGFKPTSCPDQLAKALEDALSEN